MRFIGTVVLGLACAQPLAAQQDTLYLSLPDAITRAMTVGDEIRLAHESIAAADAGVTIARAAALPQLRLTGTYTHVYKSARGQAVGAIFSQPNTYTTAANLSQTLFQGGKEFSGIRAANRLRSAARLTFEEAREDIALDVQQAYLDALLTQQLYDIQVANFQLAADRLTQVEQLQTAGRAARYDVLRARVERTNLQPAVQDAGTARDLALLDLKRLLNVPLERPIGLTSGVDTTSVRLTLEQITSDSSNGATRPDVIAAELTAKARHDAVRIAAGDLLPTISAFVQSGFQAFPLSGFPKGTGTTTVGPCASDPTRNCTTQNGGWFSDEQIGVQVTWNVFDGLKTKGNIQLARAQARIADLQYHQLQEQAAMDVAAARDAVARARASFEAQQQNVAEATEAFQLASLRFTRGLSTQLEVSDTQLALLTARTDEMRAMHDVYLAAAQLARALGRPLPMLPLAPATTTPNTTSGQ